MARPALVPELAVTDIATSLDFYCRLLGFEVRYRREKEGFAYLQLGTAELMLDQIGRGRDWVTAPLENPLGRGINLQIAVDSLDPILAALAEAGQSLFQPVETRRYETDSGALMQRQFCVLDPDGYLLRFWEAAG